MWRHFVYFFMCAFLFQCVACGCDGRGIYPCEHKTRSCTTQILNNQSDVDSCRVEYYERNSQECKAMRFRPIKSNADIGGVRLQPYVMPYKEDCNGNYVSVNLTVMNISFSNIKWKTMRFRFKPLHKDDSHCRNIVISNDVTVNDESVLYYNCYWQSTVGYIGQSHYFDFEASDGKNFNRGRFIFDIPSHLMLNSHTTEEYWRPFVYVELADNIKLHILPPPERLKIIEYKINVMKENKGRPDKVVANKTVSRENITEEVVYGFDLLQKSGSYYFMVITVHERCQNGEIECQVVKTSMLPINLKKPSLNICIASIVALVVGVLLACYVTLTSVRRMCKERSSLNEKYVTPPKILVVYPTTNPLHVKCVNSFVNYLRSEYCFDILHDGDIISTSHKNPYVWAIESLEVATHIMYIVGPKKQDDKKFYDNNIGVTSPYRELESLTRHHLQAFIETKPLKVLNVFFEYSKRKVPSDMSYYKKFYLLKDWHKLLGYLSEDMLVTSQIVRSEKGKGFIDDMNEAKKLLNSDMKYKGDKNDSLERKALV